MKIRKLLILIVFSISITEGFGQVKYYYLKHSKIIRITPIYMGNKIANGYGAELNFGYMVLNKTELSINVLATLGDYRFLGIGFSSKYYLFNSSFNIFPVLDLGMTYLYKPTKYTSFYSAIGLGMGLFNVFKRLGLDFAIGYDLINKGPYMNFGISFKIN